METPQPVGSRSAPLEPADCARAIQRDYPRVYFACHVRHTRRRTTPHALSAQDATYLGHLDRERGLPAGELARHLGIAASTLSAFVQRMQEHGYVALTACEADRRRAELRLTERGEAAVQATSVLDFRRLTEVLATMSERDRRRAVAGLRVLAEACSAARARHAAARGSEAPLP